jgi:hypothetical protein
MVPTRTILLAEELLVVPVAPVNGLSKGFVDLDI